MPRVIHYEIHADNPERAADFYRKVFGWKIEKWGPVEYWLVDSGQGPGINGAIKKRGKPAVEDSFSAYVCTISVPSIDEAMKKIEENKGRIITPKMAITGIGWNAYFKDTEGNTAGIMQEDASSK